MRPKKIKIKAISIEEGIYTRPEKVQVKAISIEEDLSESRDSGKE
jgi:hypothetical protein